MLGIPDRDAIHAVDAAVPTDAHNVDDEAAGQSAAGRRDVRDGSDQGDARRDDRDYCQGAYLHD